MKHFFPAQACLVAALALVHSGPRAQPAPELSQLSLEALLDLPVSGASRLSQSRREAPAAVTLISREQIQALGLRNLADVLRSVRGMDISSDGVYSYAAVRGMYSVGDYNTRVLLLVDGNRISDNIYDQSMLGTEFPLDLSLVERVEFIAGPGSTVYGANALFGVINVVTQAPRGDGGQRVAVRLGSDGLREARVSLDTTLAGGALLLSASSQRTHGEEVKETWFGPQTIRDTAGLSRQSFFVRWDAGPWRLNLLHATRSQGIPASPDMVLGDDRNRYFDITSLVNLEHRHALGADTEGLLRLFAGDYRFRGDYIIDYPPLGLNRDFADGRWWGGEWRLSTALGASHRLVAGAEFQRQIHQRQRNDDIWPQPINYLDDARQGLRWAVYADDQWALAKDWSLQAGLRLDDNEGLRHTSPRVSLVWRAAPEWTVKAQHGQAFRDPNAYERGYRVDGPGGWRLNPDLHGEQVASQEIGVEWGRGHWRAAASAYRNRSQGLTVLVYDPPADRYQFRNLGRLDTRGLEGELEYLHGGDRYRVNASWNQVLQAQDWPGAQAYPARMANASAVWALPGRATLALEGQARSRRGLAPGFGLLNLQLGARPWGPDWRLGLGLRNLADRVWFDPGPDAQRWPMVRGPGRQFWLELAWEGGR